MPLRDAMPASEMNPTMLATVSDCPVTTKRRHGPDRGHRQGGQYLEAQVERMEQRVQHQEHAGQRHQAQQADRPGGRLLALELAAVVQ